MLRPLALSLAGWTTAETTRARLALASEWRFRAAVLDATAPDARARDLDRSARRDLAATMRRVELAFAGLDLWIPAAHFADPARTDRAVHAALSAIELAADLATLTGGREPIVSLTLPTDDTQTRQALAARASDYGCVVADHAYPASASTALARGVDPAAVLMGGGDPAREVIEAGSDLGGARLSDVSAEGRCAVGAPGSRLDLVGYVASLTVAGYERPVICDLRQVADPAAFAAQTSRLWALEARPHPED